MNDAQVLDALIRENFVKLLNEAMLQVADPIIQKALQDAERAMRERLAQKVISMVERSYSIERMGDILTIHVNMSGDKKP
jgi:hypothetical protein